MKQKGFTLIELLVVIAIIGVLATIVLVSLNSARLKARDAKRVSDLEAIQVALELYFDSHGTYIVAGSGWSGGGQGWLGYENGTSYVTAVTRVLYNEKFLPAALIDDPSASPTSPSYMIYVCNSGRSYSLYATKENPTAADTADATAACNGATVTSTYGKNYAVGNY